MNRLEKIKWLVNNPNPCIKCGQSSYCCGCHLHYEWKAKFDKLNIDDSTNEEAYNVSAVISLKKEIEKHMLNISEEVKKEFRL